MGDIRRHHFRNVVYHVWARWCIRPIHASYAGAVHSMWNNYLWTVHEWCSTAALVSKLNMIYECRYGRHSEPPFLNFMRTVSGPYEKSVGLMFFLIRRQIDDRRAYMFHVDIPHRFRSYFWKAEAHKTRLPPAQRHSGKRSAVAIDGLSGSPDGRASYWQPTGRANIIESLPPFLLPPTSVVLYEWLWWTFPPLYDWRVWATQIDAVLGSWLTFQKTRAALVLSTESDPMCVL